MRVRHQNGTYVATRIAGPHHNYLAIMFARSDQAANPTLIALPPQGACEHQRLDPDAVLTMVLLGVADGNAVTGSNYYVLNARYVPNDTGPAEIYRELAESIVKEAFNDERTC